METTTLALEQCYHCGQDLPDTNYTLQDKKFCCQGCLSVYEVLTENNLCRYYQYNDAPGQSFINENKHTGYLDEPAVISRLADYTDDKTTVVTFYIPAIHCSSCIWLLEHLHKVNSGVAHSRIDFLKKQVCITFRQQEISLRQLVELLISLGYEPHISAKHEESEKDKSQWPQLIRKIAVAGFCMGNAMLFSFPEYFGLAAGEQHFKNLFGLLNLALIIPVTFYCASGFFSSAWAGLKKGHINIDAPLALIIIVLFLRSAFEIITEYGPGFSDTLTGLVFLLLMGRWLKQRAYQHFSFQRDYRSYFPISVSILQNGQEKTLLSDELKTGHRLLIRNNEIIAADSILIKGQARIDFSFVTGESLLVSKSPGDLIYAGGKQQGEVLELEVVKPVSQSYLTSLWNNEAFARESSVQTFNNSIARYFGSAALGIATISAIFWIIQQDSAKAWESFTAVLIVTCPCVLALSSPFILSAILRVFDKHQFHLRDTNVVEQIARTNTIVFDKTGTLTSPNRFDLSFTGYLSAAEKTMLASLSRNSNHPLSRQLVKWLGISEYLDIDYFSEFPGKGISGFIKGCRIVLGNASMMNHPPEEVSGSSIYVQVDGLVLGRFTIKMKYRDNLKQLTRILKMNNTLHLLSGDTDADAGFLNYWFPADNMHFAQSPQQKLDYIKNLQKDGKIVMMIGDGLNDAGALRQSDTGIAVSDHINNFSPACDAILNGSSLHMLPRFIALSKDGMRIIRWNFVIAASYNLAGLYFAVQGTLSPLTAAVLMPVSTVTILLFSSLVSQLYTRKHNLQCL